MGIWCEVVRLPLAGGARVRVAEVPEWFCGFGSLSLEPLLHGTGVSLATHSASHLMPCRGKVDLRARIVALPFDRQHRAFAELGVEHLHARAQAVRRRAFCTGTGGLANASRCRTPPRRGAARRGIARAEAEGRAAEALVLRREPLQRALGQLVEEAALDVVAGLAVQHAASANGSGTGACARA